ncbi:hypothetical protein [Caldimonas brevitalea]|uniref:Toxin CptA n=1 Tax=Caldimonas brevitalea TaxID=413882 RepID=A0A0G3BNY4_9BURK|nr:hypothetical protein [Caldimonas brevitalea]AKJ31164.1 hypothetical protein AAW51_4473 [Caldimonas brevitalea]
MSTAPALQVTVRHYGQWQAAVAVLLAVSAASLAGWWPALRERPVLGAAFGLVSVLTFVLAARQWRRPPCRLQWDGQQWRWQLLGRAASVEYAGRVEVLADLGPWLWLRLCPEQGGWRGRLYLPVQARGLPLSWHALRCALYSPTPAASSSAATNPALHER